MTPDHDRAARMRDKMERDHCTALQADLLRPTDNMLWMERASIALAANRERWAREDALANITPMTAKYDRKEAL